MESEETHKSCNVGGVLGDSCFVHLEGLKVSALGFNITLDIFRNRLFLLIMWFLGKKISAEGFNLLYLLFNELYSRNTLE